MPLRYLRIALLRKDIARMANGESVSAPVVTRVTPVPLSPAAQDRLLGD